MTEVVFYYLMEAYAISTTERRFDGLPKSAPGCFSSGPGVYIPTAVIGRLLARVMLPAGQAKHLLN